MLTTNYWILTTNYSIFDLFKKIKNYCEDNAYNYR
jgi:hypothetical protein